MGSTANNTINNVEIKEETMDNQNNEVEDLEWSADQEILLLYSVHGYKPVGPNKHFRMLLIQDRLSNAMNKRISSLAIWKKLNTLYDLEALDEAEAEADALVTVETDFSLPEDEFGDLMVEKLKRPSKIEKGDAESENSGIQRKDIIDEIKLELDFMEDSETEKQVADAAKGAGTGKEGKKESVKKGPKKKDLTPGKDSSPLKNANAKDTPKKDVLNKKDSIKEAKKTPGKDDEKREFGKKPFQESKKDNSKDDKKETTTKTSKKESLDKRFSDQIRKDAEVKKSDQKKNVETPKSQRVEAAKTRPETPKQLRADSSKRTETKIAKADTSKPQRNEVTPKPQRVEALKKDSSSEKKKETPDKKTERKSPEKTPESARGAKLRAREKREELDKPEIPTGTKRERSRDSVSKAADTLEEPPAKKAKTPVPKGRPTRNSIEPLKPASPAVNTPSPQKRRTRLL